MKSKGRPRRRHETGIPFFAEGSADLVSFGRQHLTDPDFIGKAEAGRFDEIRRCVACNQGCIERLTFEMKSATCTFNPECGKEYKLKLSRKRSQANTSSVSNHSFRMNSRSRTLYLNTIPHAS